MVEKEKFFFECVVLIIVKVWGDGLLYFKDIVDVILMNLKEIVDICNFEFFEEVMFVVWF